MVEVLQRHVIVVKAGRPPGETPDREAQELELRADLVVGGGCGVLVAALEHLPGDGGWHGGRLRGGGCPGGSLEPGGCPGRGEEVAGAGSGRVAGWAIQHW